jgi:hypothetical protein
VPSGVVSVCLHIVLNGTVAAPYEAAWCRSNRESIQNQRSERHRSQRRVLLRVLGGMCCHDRMGRPLPDQQCTVKARASRDRLRRLSALTALRWPGSLPPCDHGLLCAIAPKLQRKREVAARQRDMAWTSAVLWIGQACHTGAMAPAQESRRRRVPADASLDDLYDYVAAPARPGRRRANRASVTLRVTDNWPEDVPVTEAEIAVFEAWFGELFDELFGEG